MVDASTPTENHRVGSSILSLATFPDPTYILRLTSLNNLEALGARCVSRGQATGRRVFKKEPRRIPAPDPSLRTFSRIEGIG